MRVAGLRFRWARDQPLVLDVPSFDVGVGEAVFLRGPSGTGKSTLLNVIAGVSKPEAGVVHVMGQDLAALSGPRRDRHRADHIGIVFQMFNLLPYLSLIDNVLLPCRFSALRRQRVLDGGTGLRTEAARLLGRMHLDAAALGGRMAARISQGQQQRVAAARALIGRPGLIVADEPTSAIDDDARDAFLDLLFQEAEAAGAALIFVSHDRRLGPRFDRTVDLADINHASAK